MIARSLRHVDEEAPQPGDRVLGREARRATRCIAHRPGFALRAGGLLPPGGRDGTRIDRERAHPPGDRHRAGRQQRGGSSSAPSCRTRCPAAAASTRTRRASSSGRRRCSASTATTRAGKVVAELTAANARDRRGPCTSRTRRAAWYDFDVALDIPEAAAPAVERAQRALRRRGARGARRSTRARARCAARTPRRGVRHRHVRRHDQVYLGELRTDDAGRLLFLGGRGVSASYTGDPNPITLRQQRRLARRHRATGRCARP